ncbi:hypothetical protein CANARDRAFT_223461 [[Candida] arabinofermentans NRRL YB-2248]|uniref:LSM2-LSM8 complex subunit LSM8 n=1 Tax=[Candida] arabinofermentans NRRL YB-2248 TaxID=983967 RepID=A0A1E4SYN8_9ASCO|nr:hypothetical protein CANARDRAFT_223461 [[Candida] arabinofermentans NRRL YB-2248]
MSSLQPFLEHKVKVITTDGQLFIGILEGYDKTINLVLSSTIERIFSIDEPKNDIELGTYLIRGDQVVCVGLVEEEIENEIDYSDVFAAKLKGTKNPLI